MQIFHHRAVCDCPAHLGLRTVLLESVDQLRIASGIQHIPHLGLAKLTVFVLLCVGVGGVYLHRQIFLGIDKFDEDRQSILTLVALSQILRVRSQHLCQLLPIKGTAYHIAGAVRMGRTLPGLCQRGQVDVFFKFIVQTAAAPKIILAGRSEQKRLVLVLHNCLLRCLNIPARTFACRGRRWLRPAALR